VEPFIALLTEPTFTVLLALIESLDISDEGKSSDEVADVLCVFLKVGGEALCRRESAVLGRWLSLTLTWRRTLVVWYPF
jgi:hypothetical protein